MSELKVWEFVSRHLESEGQIGLMVVVQSEGSSPGRKGFKMAVASDGDMIGSIGGGIMEHKLVEYIRNKLSSQEPFHELRKQIHSKDAPRDQSGMICSGTQWIAMVRLDRSGIASIQEIVDALKSGNRIQLELDESGLSISPFNPETQQNHSGYSNPDSWLYTETLGSREVIHVIGGGHVGLEMCRVMSLMDFHVVNYDDRPGLNTMQANEFAHEKVVVPYSTLDSLIEGGSSVYVIVMTFGYRGDDEAIRALLGKQFAYLGMMGSQTKVDKLLLGLEQDGFPAAEIARIHTPAGLTIHSKAPIEIAISVAAEIIEIKNNRSLAR